MTQTNQEQMETKKNLEGRRKRHGEHIDKYRGSPLVQSVLSEDSTFKDEVEDFYGLSVRRIYGQIGLSYLNFSLEDEESQKIGRLPSDLLGILDPFKEGFVDQSEFDESRLSYEGVRRDYSIHAQARNKVRRITNVLGFLGILPGILYGYYNQFSEEPQTIGTYPKPEGTNYELGEFLRMWESSRKADSFMDDNYRPNFVKEALAET